MVGIVLSTIFLDLWQNLAAGTLLIFKKFYKDICFLEICNSAKNQKLFVLILNTSTNAIV